MPLNKLPRASAPTLLLLCLLATSCSTPTLTPLPALPVVPSSPVKPALESTAKQPPPPPECLPTCIEGLTRLRKSTLSKLTSAATPASSANAPTR